MKLKMSRTLLACVALAVFGITAQAQAPPPTKPFDWHGYDERQTACKLYDQMLWQCTQ